MSLSERFNIKIPSCPEEARPIQERILTALERLSYSEREVFGMRMALEEAIVNAIKHGNSMDATKQVFISCCIDAGLARVEIEDEGRGFSLADVPDPTALENLDKPCGRGIMLMQAYVDVEFNERGNRVVLEKHRNGSP